MPRRLPVRPDDLRGAVRLATDATVGLASLVEAVHARIASLPGVAVRSERTRGITGLVYRSVRGVARGVGGGVDRLLGLLAPALDDGLPSAERDALLAALNGVLGDHLAASGNPLAMAMELRHDDRPLTPQDGSGTRLLVLLHGLCMNDRQWLREGHDHGRALARDLGYTPVYLRYNSGLHIARNGAGFAEQMQALLAAWPQPLQRVTLLGHSMGGLVARSALHQAQAAGARWPARIDDLVCLGAPHHGAPLERAGHGVDLLLGATPYAAPFARLGRLRSAGITDLRHANLLDEPADRFASGQALPTPVPLPAGVRSWAFAAQLGEADSATGRMQSRVLGDGLVPLDSALGRHPDPARTLAFAPERQWIAHDTGHLALLSSPAVYARLRDALGD